MSTHRPLNAEYAEFLRDLARAVHELLNSDPDNPRMGFGLLMFPFDDAVLPGDDGPRINYVSNASREDMLVAMKEFIARAEGMDPPTGGTA